jgi:hypothetical protein
MSQDLRKDEVNVLLESTRLMSKKVRMNTDLIWLQICNNLPGRPRAWWRRTGTTRGGNRKSGRRAWQLHQDTVSVFP